MDIQGDIKRRTGVVQRLHRDACPPSHLNNSRERIGLLGVFHLQGRADVAHRRADGDRQGRRQHVLRAKVQRTRGARNDGYVSANSRALEAQHDEFIRHAGAQSFPHRRRIRERELVIPIGNGADFGAIDRVSCRLITVVHQIRRRGDRPQDT